MYRFYIISSQVHDKLFFWQIFSDHVIRHHKFSVIFRFLLKCHTVNALTSVFWQTGIKRTDHMTPLCQICFHLLFQIFIMINAVRKNHYLIIIQRHLTVNNIKLIAQLLQDTHRSDQRW